MPPSSAPSSKIIRQIRNGKILLALTPKLKTGSSALAAGNRLQRLEKMAAQIRRCVKCPLHQSRTLAVPGEGLPAARFMIIGEAPGKDEDKTGQPFVGSAGRYLDHVLEGTKIQRSDFFITNIVKCRPPANRTPQAMEIATCTSNYLFEQIALI